MKWIDDIISEIQSSKNSLIKDIYDKIPDSENKFDLFCEELKNKESDFLLRIFISLNFSVLEGEYLEDSFSEKITELISLVDTFFHFPDLSFILITAEEGKYSEYLSKVKFLVSFKLCLEEYSKNQKFINDIIGKLDKILVFNLSDRALNIIDDLKLEKKEFELILSLLFLKNLTLSRKEFTLRDDEENLEALLNLNISFKECETNFPFQDDKIKFVINILIDKVTFLIRKLIIRKNQVQGSENQYYVASGVERFFLLNEHPFINNHYESWCDYSQFHYLSDNNEVYQRKLRLYENNNKTFWDKHRSLKIAKDFNKSIVDLENIALDEVVIGTTKFDIYSKKISDIYIKNCILSCSIEKEKLNISLSFNFEEFLIKEKNKIKDLELSIKNFFPYKKLCEFIISYIEFLNKELKKEDWLNAEIIEKLESSNNHLDEIVKKYKDTLYWCRNHFFYAFQLPFNECTLTNKFDETLELKVFSPSTFSLPLDYVNLLKEIELLERKIENEKYELKNLKNFSILFKKFDGKLLIQEKELENSKIKNIELLGIFSAIIALLFQGVNTAQSSERFEFKFLTFVTMFVVLCSFLLLLRHFLFKDQNTINIVKWFSMYLLVIMLTILGASIIFTI